MDERVMRMHINTKKIEIVSLSGNWMGNKVLQVQRTNPPCSLTLGSSPLTVEYVYPVAQIWVNARKLERGTYDLKTEMLRQRSRKDNSTKWERKD